MDLLFVNKADQEIPEVFLQDWVNDCVVALEAKGHALPSAVEELILVFVDEVGISELNRDFRSKDKPTDVLSFEPVEESCLGELAFCTDVILRNAAEHKLSYQQELAYMCLHGMLHLLGFEHETSEDDAKLMFELQDGIFEELSARF